MTREEALQWLTNEKWKNANNKYKKEWNEAFDMAIEALSQPIVCKDYRIDDDHIYCSPKMAYRVVKALQDRPTDEWCTDCKEYDHEKHCCPRFNRVIRTTLNEAVANLKEEFESAEYEDYEHATLVDIKEPLKVLVVRCKDCIYQVKEKGLTWCSHNDGLCGDANDNDYCVHGERSE